MRNKWALSAVVVVLAAAVGSGLLSPGSLGGESKDMVELLTDAREIQQGQRDLQSSFDTKIAEVRTLVQQDADNSNKLSSAINGIQKTVQDSQANSTAQLNPISSGVEGVSSNLSDMQTRISKMSQQLADLQNSLQSLDAKVTALAAPANPQPGAPSQPSAAANANPVAPGAVAPSAANPAAAPPSGESLYNDARNDVVTGKYDLAQQEFSDYLKFYPAGPYAPNCYFYVGEVNRAQQHFEEAIDAYSTVITKFPDSSMLASAMYQRGVAYLVVGKRTQGIADLRTVIRRFPGSQEEGYARDRLKSLGVSAVPNQKD